MFYCLYVRLRVHLRVYVSQVPHVSLVIINENDDDDGGESTLNKRLNN